MDKNGIEVIVRGNIEVNSLSEQQQKAIYATLLARVLSLHKEQLENKKED